MKTNRTEEIRGVLSDHAATDARFFAAQSSIGKASQESDAERDTAASAIVVHAMIHCEKRQAAEIELLFDKNGNVNEATECTYCGSWTISELGCVCVFDRCLRHDEYFDKGTQCWKCVRDATPHPERETFEADEIAKTVEAIQWHVEVGQ